MSGKVNQLAGLGVNVWTNLSLLIWKNNSTINRLNELEFTQRVETGFELFPGSVDAGQNFKSLVLTEIYFFFFFQF